MGPHALEAESEKTPPEAVKHPKVSKSDSVKSEGNRKASFRRPGKPRGVLKPQLQKKEKSEPKSVSVKPKPVGVKHEVKNGKDKSVVVETRAACVSEDDVYKGTYDISCLPKESYPSCSKANLGLHSYTLTSGTASIEVLLRHSAYFVKRVAWMCRAWGFASKAITNLAWFDISFIRSSFVWMRLCLDSRRSTRALAAQARLAK